MTKKKTKSEMEIVPTSGTVTSPLVIPADDVEETVVLEEETTWLFSSKLNVVAMWSLTL